MLENFSDSEHESSLVLCFDLILLELPLIEPIELREDERGQLVNLFVNHLITVLSEAT